MPNDFFQFKHFRIEQGDCAMKVTTDGCLFGASIELTGKEKNVLDIGAGTGLLSLMIAQRSKARIHAVEMDESAAQQATQNFANSPWASRMTLFTASIQGFVTDRVAPYDLVVCNPPFFRGHLRSGTTRDVAIHDDMMPKEDLVLALDKLVAADGQFWVMYPAHEFEQFNLLAAQQGWHCQKRIEVYNQPGKSVFRVMGALARDGGQCEVTTVCIRDSSGSYSPEFAALVEDYYL